MKLNGTSLCVAVASWLLLGLLATACEDEHPPAVMAPVANYTLKDARGATAAEIAFDPRGMRLVKTVDKAAANWVLEPDTHGAWDYREWQWWKGHPWGESCRPRYWTKAKFDPEQKNVTIRYTIDGFHCTQQYFLPELVEADSPHWDLITTIQNVSGGDVEEYAQFFACYTTNQRKSFWFWEAGGQLTRFADRGVHHLNGYVAHPQAYFLSDGAIPHCPRGGGKIVATWQRPVLVSRASSDGWRSVILVEADRTAALAQGIGGNAMDYILFPGPKARTFANGSEFSAHIRHYLIKSADLPSRETLEALWRQFEASHEILHRVAEESR